MGVQKHIPRYAPRTSVLAASISALIATGGLNTAWAQDEEDENSQATNEDTIVVTGTRIRRDDFTAPNATSVVTGDDMRQLGVISVADMVNQLPNNIASVSPQANPDSAFNMGASIANLRGMNTFSGTRTLTMVDSKRMVATNNGGGVDLNFIPSALVGRIETVTGGGGATYGADAMAGVVNVILDTNIEGIRFNGGYQTTAEGDGDRYNFGFATGKELLDGRGHFTIGIDYSNQDAIEDCRSRDYCKRDMGILRNGTGIGTGFFGFGPPAPYSQRQDIVFDGQPQWLILDGMNHTILTEGMLLADGFTTDCPSDPGLPDALTCGAWRFNAAGTDIVPYLDNLTPEQRESVDTEGAFGVTPWGEGKSPYAAVPLLPETERGNIFTRFAYQLEGGIEIVADLSYGQTENRVRQKQTRDNMQSFCIRNDNAYLLQGSQTMQDVFAARWTSGVFTPNNFGGLNDWAIQCDEPPFMGGSFFDDREDGRFDFGPGTVMFKDMSEHLDRENHNKTDVTNFTLNANGDLFEGGSWTWDTYLQIGRTNTKQDIANWRSDNRLQMAVDAVIDPQTGEIVCRLDSSD
ncbi:MAG: TonB-dependent receptor plug domain-containing protein, partial [Gammaproteobacteria bacterium]